MADNESRKAGLCVAGLVRISTASSESIFRVTLAPRHIGFDASASETLLHAALRAQIHMPSSCRNGTCRACLCRMTSGQVVYRIEWPGLSREEKEEGFILPCVAHPISDLVIERLD
jgi:ferredoxin